MPDLKGSNARWCLHVLPLGDLQELKTSQQHSLIRRKGWCLGCQLWGRLSSPLSSSSRNSWISCFMAALQRGRGDSILISFAFMLRSRSLFIRLNPNKARGESVWRRAILGGNILPHPTSIWTTTAFRRVADRRDQIQSLAEDPSRTCSST